jgi:hypothetical protein
MRDGSDPSNLISVLNAKKGSVRSYELGLVSRVWALFLARALTVKLEETLDDFVRVGGAHVTGDSVEFIVVDIQGSMSTALSPFDQR